MNDGSDNHEHDGFGDKLKHFFGIGAHGANPANGAKTETAITPTPAEAPVTLGSLGQEAAPALASTMTPLPEPTSSFPTPTNVPSNEVQPDLPDPNHLNPFGSPTPTNIPTIPTPENTSTSTLLPLPSLSETPAPTPTSVQTNFETSSPLTTTSPTTSGFESAAPTPVPAEVATTAPTPLTNPTQS